MNTRIPTITSHQMLKVLLRNGFFIHHQTGSHIILKREKDKRRVVLPFHPCDLHRGVMKSIQNQAGLSDEEFMALIH